MFSAVALGKLIVGLLTVTVPVFEPTVIAVPLENNVGLTGVGNKLLVPDKPSNPMACNKPVPGLYVNGSVVVS